MTTRTRLKRPPAVAEAPEGARSGPRASVSSSRRAWRSSWPPSPSLTRGVYLYSVNFNVLSGAVVTQAEVSAPLRIPVRRNGTKLCVSSFFSSQGSYDTVCDSQPDNYGRPAVLLSSGCSLIILQSTFSFFNSRALLSRDACVSLFKR